MMLMPVVVWSWRAMARAVNTMVRSWCQVVEATSRRSYASRGVSHPKAALGRSLSSSAMAPVVGLVCGDLGAFG